MGIRSRYKIWKDGKSPHQGNVGVNVKSTDPAKTPAVSNTTTSISSSVNFRSQNFQTRQSTEISRSTSHSLLTTTDASVKPPATEGTEVDGGRCNTSQNDASSLFMPSKDDPEDLWQLSFDELSQEEQGQLQAFLTPSHVIANEQTQSMSFKCTDFEDLIVVTRKKQDGLSDKIWKFDFYGRKIVPRDYTARVITCLTTVGDASVQLMPQPASIVWPLVKGLMQVPVDADEETAAVLMTADILVRTIRCGKTYETIFREKIKNQHTNLWTDFQSALLKLYVTSLRFLVYALRQCDKRTGRRLVNALLNPSKAQDQVSDLESCRSHLREVVLDCRSKIDDDVDATVMEFLEKFSMFNSVIEQRFDELFERLDRQEVIEILDWISQYRELDRHHLKAEARTPKTCGWLLENSVFKEWEQSSSPAVIWLQGLPGTGKSFLTSRVIDDLRANLHPGEGLAFYYCQRSGQTFEDPSDVIRALFRQLATPAHEFQEDEMRKDVRDLYAQSKRMTHPSLSICKQQIIKSVSQYSQTTIVLDALDECAEPRNELFDLIDSLVSQSEYPVRIFISARPESDIEERFHNEPIIKTEVPDVKEDIKSFIDKKIGELRWNSNTVKFREEAVEALVEKSDGMFLWASLQIEQLRNVQLGKALLRRISRMPQGLTRTYKEIYEQISADEDQKIVVDRAFLWVMCSYGPMRSEQLLAAIRHDENHNELEEVIDKNTLLSLCKNLLVFDQPLNRFRFCHASVSEYIENELWNSQRAHCYAAKSCLRFLMLAYGEPAASTVPKSGYEELMITTQKDPELHEDSVIFSRDYPFHFYSRHHWMRHIQRQEYIALDSNRFDYPLNALLREFLSSPSRSGPVYQAWHQDVSDDVRLIRDTAIFTDFSTLEDISPPTLPILAVCRFSFNTILQDWWDRDDMFLTYFNKQNETPLIIAVRAGCISICEKLLNRKAFVDHSGDRSSALATAAFDGKLGIARLLIQKGATVDLALHGDFGSALATAVSTGNLDMVRLLIENGATVDMPLQGDYRSALATAVSFGDSPMIELLLENRANVDLELQGHCGSALSVAVSTSRLDIVKLLIEKGAKIDMELQDRFRSALTTAAFFGDLNMIKLLVQEGATIDMPMKRDFQGNFGSALAAAAQRGQLQVAEYFIEKGANIDLELPGLYGTALAAAACGGGRAMIEFLVNKGATVDMEFQGSSGSALALAAFTGNLSGAECLIENGATVDLALEGKFGSALAAAVAASHGNIPVIDLLIRKGAKVNMALRGSYGSALATAARKSRVPTAVILIENGATVNAVLQGDYGSALAAAACSGSLQMTEYLTQNGATVDMVLPAGHFGSALAAAAAAGWVGVVEYLVDTRGADVNLPLIAGSYGTALNAASHWGADRMCEDIARCWGHCEPPEGPFRVQ
ncbi:Mur ligase C-terminal [Penicillium expansum]|nr:Mur ligase C-terminal [Penicillium expansum]